MAAAIATPTRNALSIKPTKMGPFQVYKIETADAVALKPKWMQPRPSSAAVERAPSPSVAPWSESVESPRPPPSAPSHRPNSARQARGKGSEHTHGLFIGNNVKHRPAPKRPPSAPAAAKTALATQEPQRKVIVVPRPGSLPREPPFPAQRNSGVPVSVDKSIRQARDLLARFRSHAPSMNSDPELHGRGVAAWLQEQWDELHAWCGYLAAGLDQATGDIQVIADERTRTEGRVSELEQQAAFLEHLCSQRNITGLQRKIETLQNLNDHLSSVRKELDGANRVIEKKDGRLIEVVKKMEEEEKAKKELARRMEAAEEEAQAARAELQSERAQRYALEEKMEVVEAEVKHARAAAVKAKEEVARGAERTVEAVAKVEAAAAAAAVEATRKLRQAERCTEAVRTDLSLVEESLESDRKARMAAEAKLAEVEQQLEVALRACQQLDSQR